MCACGLGVCRHSIEKQPRPTPKRTSGVFTDTIVNLFYFFLLFTRENVGNPCTRAESQAPPTEKQDDIWRKLPKKR